VLQGVRWGIGDGVKTRILKDNWIPGVSLVCIQTLIPLLDDATVNILIDDESRAWDQDVVRSFFDEHIPEKILAIPLSRLHLLAPCSVWCVYGSVGVQPSQDANVRSEVEPDGWSPF
jgi:hypothetical protein